MKPLYWNAASAGRDRWMVSYMDMLTVLLIFFIAAAAQSLKTLQRKTEPPAPHPAASKSPAPQPTLSRLHDQLIRQGLSSALEFHLDSRGLIINLSQAALFAPGEDRISAASLPIIDQVATILRGLPNRVSLIGHADSVPIHNRRFRNNWELSASRSLQLLELLNTEYGIPESRLSVESKGAFNPRTANDTVLGRAHNRRVEIVIWDEELLKPDKG